MSRTKVLCKYKMNLTNNPKYTYEALNDTCQHIKGNFLKKQWISETPQSSVNLSSLFSFSLTSLFHFFAAVLIFLPAASNTLSFLYSSVHHDITVGTKVGTSASPSSSSSSSCLSLLVCFLLWVFLPSGNHSEVFYVISCLSVLL